MFVVLFVVLLYLWSHTFRFICVYQPPGLSVISQADAVSLVTCLSNLLISKKEFYIVSGDFNLPSINWLSLSSPCDGVHNIMLHFLLIMV